MIHVSFVLSGNEYPKLGCGAALARIGALALVVGPFIPSETWAQHRDVLAETEVIFSGWSAPLMDESFLAAVPKLKAVFYAAGSIRYFTTQTLCQRNIRITAAPALNAIPVSEYTSSVILLGLKRFWHHAHLTREERTFRNGSHVAGAYKSTVGLISYGSIARLVRQRLLASDVKVVVYDPFLSPREARSEQIELLSLEEVFATSDAISVHTPLLEETVGLIKGHHFKQMKEGAIFVNTARGEIVDQPEMIACLRARPDLQAVLDATSPEPPEKTSLLYSLPNVVLTPHIAGSLGNECQRMGNAMVDEFDRYLRNEPLEWELNAKKAAAVA